MLNRDIRKKDTPQELLVLEWVRATGLGANPQEDFPPYVVDVYVPDLDLAIEVDGPLHLRKSDKKRDLHLKTKYGVDTWRIPLKKMAKSYKGEFTAELQKLIKNKINATALKYYPGFEQALA